MSAYVKGLSRRALVFFVSHRFHVLVNTPRRASLQAEKQGCALPTGAIPRRASLQAEKQGCALSTGPIQASTLCSRLRSTAPRHALSDAGYEVRSHCASTRNSRNSRQSGGLQ